ncbi:MAG: S-layer family protein [Cyanobacteria bacterium P01_E01_bin.42]
MKTLWSQFSLQALSLCLLTVSVQAQVSQDSTPINTQVDSISVPDTFKIEGGQTLGDNLFHSFDEFTIPDSMTATFQNSHHIENIIGRVTGNSISEIYGTVETQGMANLYLLNPNGIIFGENAKLNIGGSFFATTADRIVFADGTEFSATEIATNPILTISVPTAFQFGDRAGSIRVQGNGHNIGIGQFGEAISLTPNNSNSQNLVLLGNGVSLDGGNLIARDKRIEIGSVGDRSRVGITADLALDYTHVRDFQDISLSNRSSIDVTGNGGGAIALHGGQITITEGSSVLAIAEGANTGGNVAINASEMLALSGSKNGFPSSILTETSLTSTGSAGNVAISTPQLTIQAGAQISSSTFSSGRGGNIQINADDIIISGTNSTGNPSGLYAGTANSGNAGNIEIDSDRISLQEGGRIVTDTISSGRGGNISVTANTLDLKGMTPDELSSGLFAITMGFAPAGTIAIDSNEIRVSEGARISALTLYAKQPGGDITINTDFLEILSGSQLQAGTFGAGDGGNIQIRADEISLQGAGRSVSGIFSQVNEIDATGNSGNAILETRKLSVTDGAQISVSTFGIGNSGELAIDAAESVEVSGRGQTSDRETISSGILAQVNADASGNGGDLDINTARLNVTSGAGISVGTIGTGYSGNLAVNAESVTLREGEISARTRASGNAGNLDIDTQTLTIADGANVTVESLGTGDAGNLSISARLIDINRGQITGGTTSGEGGNLSILSNDIRLLNRSLISTTAGTADAPGNGGNITILADTVVGLQNSDITANSFQGEGGRIDITAQGIFGLKFRENLTPLNDITAISLFDPSLNGEVHIQTPEIDPTQGLTDIPTLENPEPIARVCPARATGRRELKLGGRGMPSGSADALTSSDDGLISAIAPVTSAGQAIAPADRQPVERSERELLLARGWYINDSGQLILTEAPIENTPQISAALPTGCND